MPNLDFAPRVRSRPLWRPPTLQGNTSRSNTRYNDLARPVRTPQHTAVHAEYSARCHISGRVRNHPNSPRGAEVALAGMHQQSAMHQFGAKHSSETFRTPPAPCHP